MQMRQTFHFYSDAPEIKTNCLAFISQLPSNDKWQVTIEKIEKNETATAVRLDTNMGKEP